MLQRLARFCYRRRWRVLGAWVVLLVGLFALNSSFGGKFLDEFDLPGSESQEAVDLLEEHGFDTRAGATGQIVFKTDNVNDPTVRRDMEALFDQIAEVTAPSEVVSPYSEEGAHQISEDDTIAYAEVNLSDRDSDELVDIGEQARAIVADANVPGTEVELGGDIAFEQPPFSSEVVGFIAALIILLIAFGSLLAAGLPLITAIFGIVTGIAIVGLAVNVIGMPSFSNQAVAMIGIGVGIDYALFIVTRYREGLQDGLTPECATMRALDTAGRAVLFAGCTVIIAILGLFTIGLDLIRGLAVGISIGVLMTMLAALTLLPAILGFVGNNIDRLGLPHRRRAERAGHQSVWYRWSRVIQRRPWPAALGLRRLPDPADHSAVQHADGIRRCRQSTDRLHSPPCLRPDLGGVWPRCQRPVAAGRGDPGPVRPPGPRGPVPRAEPSRGGRLRVATDPQRVRGRGHHPGAAHHLAPGQGNRAPGEPPARRHHSAGRRGHDGRREGGWRDRGRSWTSRGTPRIACRGSSAPCSCCRSSC